MIFHLKDIRENSTELVGGKSRALARILEAGYNVPTSIAIESTVYTDFLKKKGLQEKILLELNRKPFEELRWEEIWDISLRIRNLFLTTELSDFLTEPLLSALSAAGLENKPLVVRSSARDEDNQETSFAGLHDSILNVRSGPELFKAIKLVWASLWSDRALLYRQEMNLSVEESAMPVLIQEMIESTSSGIVFSMSPDNAEQMVIESVFGLNQALVDGSIGPDRWVLSRADHSIESCHRGGQDKKLAIVSNELDYIPLSDEDKNTPPLTDNQVSAVARTARNLEDFFSAPQDVEWTFLGDELIVLQSRPITTIGKTKDPEKRSKQWYLSLTVSLENLLKLSKDITEEILPEMTRVANELNTINLTQLSDTELESELSQRQSLHRKWTDIYWDYLIPFAHGMRLFGQVYNDVMQPTDPFEFMQILGAGKMKSIERNDSLAGMASEIAQNSQLKELIEKQSPLLQETEFYKNIQQFLDSYHDAACYNTQCFGDEEKILHLLLRLAESEIKIERNEESRKLEKKLFDSVPLERAEEISQLLSLARLSYQMRDDDNIYLGRIEGQVIRVREEIASRREDVLPADGNDSDSLRALTGIDHPSDPVFEQKNKEYTLPMRQIVGQPASPGLAIGKARLVRTTADIYSFEKNEILICDAIDPNMTFIVPLAQAIVERRGGMLIHGAIIAREYSIPCVTGIAEALENIQTGDLLTVDGHLGIVTIHRQTLDPFTMKDEKVQ